jgi:hypothetical protein
MSTPTADQLLMGGGAPSAKFKRIGDEVAGTVVTTEVRDQTDFKTGEVLTWRDGSVRKMVVATLQTQQFDGPDDDGQRRLFIKGKSLTDAVRDAVRKAGGGGLELGGWLKVSYVADGQAIGNDDPPKLYLAEFTRPQQQAANEVLNRTAPTQQSYQQTAPQQGYQQPPQQGYPQPPAPQQGYQQGGYAPQQDYQRPAAQPPF